MPCFTGFLEDPRSSVGNPSLSASRSFAAIRQSPAKPYGGTGKNQRQTHCTRSLTFAIIRTLIVDGFVDLTMARTFGRLTALKVEKAKRPGMYADGGGLYSPSLLLAARPLRS
jgi:hypothetical protein